MNIDELQQKFNEMRRKKWRMVDGRQPVEITGFFIGFMDAPVIVGRIKYSILDINPETLCDIYSGEPLIEEVIPYADWTIDAKAYFWDEGASVRYKRHFAGVNADGRPMSWCGGCTSWTVADSDPEPFSWDHAELAEDQQ